jgi:hypothetical protein
MLRVCFFDVRLLLGGCGVIQLRRVRTISVFTSASAEYMAFVLLQIMAG